MPNRTTHWTVRTEGSGFNAVRSNAVSGSIVTPGSGNGRFDAPPRCCPPAQRQYLGDSRRQRPRAGIHPQRRFHTPGAGNGQFENMKGIAIASR
jgi:hypothetical protein